MSIHNKESVAKAAGRIQTALYGAALFWTNQSMWWVAMNTWNFIRFHIKIMGNLSARMYTDTKGSGCSSNEGVVVTDPR